MPAADGKIAGANRSVILCEVFAQAVNPEAGIAGLDFQEQLCRSQLVVKVKGCRSVRHCQPAEDFYRSVSLSSCRDLSLASCTETLSTNCCRRTSMLRTTSLSCTFFHSSWASTARSRCLSMARLAKL